MSDDLDGFLNPLDVPVWNRCDEFAVFSVDSVVVLLSMFGNGGFLPFSGF